MLATLLLFTLSFFNTAIAQTLPTANTLEATTPTQKIAPQPSYCPEPAQLIHDTSTNSWGFDNWHSQSPSFSKAVLAFQGAQWVGVNVGNIICIYQGDNKLAFPITVQNSTLVEEPQGEHWEPYMNGRRNCHALSDVTDCPFIIPKKKKDVDIYEQIDFLKNKSRAN